MKNEKIGRWIFGIIFCISFYMLIRACIDPEELIFRWFKISMYLFLSIFIGWITYKSKEFF